MKYYKTWQLAFMDFIREHGDEFQDSYNLSVEFESVLRQNRAKAFYMV